LCARSLAFQLLSGQLPERVRDLPLALISGVQVNQRRPGAAVTHPGHQLPEVRPGCCGQGVAGMAQIVEVHGWQSG